MFAQTPFNAITGSIAEPPDVIIIPVHWTSGGKHQSVSRETRNLDDHDFFTQTAVYLKVKE